MRSVPFRSRHTCPAPRPIAWPAQILPCGSVYEHVRCFQIVVSDVTPVQISKTSCYPQNDAESFTPKSSKHTRPPPGDVCISFPRDKLKDQEPQRLRPVVPFDLNDIHVPQLAEFSHLALKLLLRLYQTRDGQSLDCHRTPILEITLTQPRSSSQKRLLISSNREEFEEIEGCDVMRSSGVDLTEIKC
ncbi:hypothetical protein YC2023_107453 [Brassica napus]